MNTPSLENNLLYRRQYFIGPKFLDEFPDWNNVNIGNTVHITAHPDLEITTQKRGDTELALLGFMFDSQNYKATNSDIIGDLISDNYLFSDLITATSQYAGRWILIYSNDDEVKLIHDPGGLRQIFYCRHDSETWCSAQPHILAKILGKEKNNDKDLSSFLKSKAFEEFERSLIGTKSLYKDIYHLVPNHYLDLNDCSTFRYWPNNSVPSLPMEEVVNQSCNMFTELIKAATFRHQVAHTITAGWDTRLLLAASRSIKDNILYFVHRLPGMEDDHEDIYIPKQLSENHNLNLNVVDCSEYNSDFDRVSSQNVYMVQSDYKKLQYYNYLSDFQDKLIISGNASQLMKKQFPALNEITTENLARLLKSHNNKYAKMEISRWLETAIAYEKHINIEDLFYWEMRYGSWAPMYNTELDIATEEFSPYNCRDIIMTMSMLPVSYRSKPDVLLYSKIINQLWPELLNVPINPNSLVKKDKGIRIQQLIKFLKKIGLYKITRFLFRKIIIR